MDHVPHGAITRVITCLHGVWITRLPHGVITWQVDRKCHMVSASSFDKMCADMLAMADDMSGDVHPHGARELVADQYAANNQQTRK